VAAFLGVPYAKPPVGTLRWRDPEPAIPWSGTRDATRFSAACYQAPSLPWGPFTTEFLNQSPLSEDCLYLNIWAPKSHTTPLPVVVFIHGGGFGSGSSSVPIYDGQVLAGRGVVVVTINYRLGVFGFLAHPALSRESHEGSSGEYGLLDMVAALKWVRNNIGAFSGDPADVTIGGQSAGAAAVNDLLVSPVARGLFSRAVAQSGSGMGVGMLTIAQAEHIGTLLAEKLGVATIEQLRALSAESLMKATVVHAPSSNRKGPPGIVFAPNLDGKVLPVDPEQPLAKPESDVPLLTGFDTDEGEIMGRQPTTPADFEAAVRARYGDFATRLLQAYPHGNVEQATDSAILIARDRYMAGLLLWSQARTASSGEPIYGYPYDHPYPGPDPARFGAFHTAEVPYVFGALHQEGRSFTQQDHGVSQHMQDYWVAFFRSGTPAPSWPLISGHSTQVMKLGSRFVPVAAVSSPERLSIFRDYHDHGGKLSLF
jgi:para-nitrobenzyl esterase